MSKENDKNFEFKEYPKYFGYIVSETHWDREWYLTFKEFQKWLVRLIDKLIDGLKDHPNFVSFMLDGQTCPIEDYLQIRPYNETKIKELVKDKRLVIGPFYVLADEFLESGEAMIRNLLLGHKIGKKFGHTMKVGYVPDTFGHIWQLPQILKGFGIKYATAYRGYPPLFGNHEEWKGHNDNTPLEFYWQAPDGSSSIIMYHLLRGYGNAVDICQNPVVIDGNKVFVQGISRISDTWHAIKERQLTPIQLYLNGSDHKEAELDLPEFVEFFNNEEDIQEELNLELKHSTLENYFEDLEKFITENGLKIPTLTGEWRGSMYTQVTPACISTRMYLKQENFQSQMQLEKYSEPLSAIAKFMGGTYDTDMLWESWRWLIKNHPHDSICGCSIDRVHDDMETRFCWSQDVSKDMMYKALSQIALGINDKKILDKIKAKNQISIQKYITLIMFNPNLSPNSVESVAEELISINYNFDYRLFDEDGNEISDFIIEKIKDYRELPQAQYLYKRFHGNYSVGKVSIFDNSKSIGYKTYMLCGVSKSSQKSEGSKTINNGYLTFEELPKKEFRGKKIIFTLNKNGSFNIKDLKSNRTYNNLNILEDMADDGDEYDYSPLKDEIPLLSKDLNAKFRILDDNKLRSVIEIAIDFYVPKDLLNDGPRGVLERKRNPDKIKLHIICELTIYSDQDVVRIKLKLNNQAKSHRLRALFPTGIQSDYSFADDHFMVMKRTIELPRDDGWYQDMQGLYHNDTWVDICNDEYGLAVFNKGLPEFEIVDRTKFGLEGNTIALTLFRSVGWMSKAGHLGRKSGTNGPNIPTPGAQCPRYFEFEYAVFPHKDSWEKGGVYEHAYSYCYPPVIFDKNQAQNFRVDILKDLPASCSIIGAENENIQLTSLKFSEPDLASKEGVIARFFNANTKKVDAKFYIHPEFKKVYRTNLLEEVIEELNLINNDGDTPDNPHEQKSLKIKMKPNEILTLLLTF